MHPHVFLDTLWRLDLRPEVFVAMPFNEKHKQRFAEVIRPVVEEMLEGGGKLTAHRVDLSQSGDSILTQIVDGIGHASLVLADVSTVGHDAESGRPYRNANVMYEVGLALACRDPAEVLLVHDDSDPLLFDVSSVPHRRIQFADVAAARQDLKSAMEDRLRERDHLRDARVSRAVDGLSPAEVDVIKNFADRGTTRPWGFKKRNHGLPFTSDAALPGLLEKGIARRAGEYIDGAAMYVWSQLGAVVVQAVLTDTRKFAPSQPPLEPPNSGNPGLRS